MYRQQDNQLHPSAVRYCACSAAWCHTTYQEYWFFGSSFTKCCCCAVLLLRCVVICLKQLPYVKNAV